jgi:DNA mismatch endonuclease (patch repair protein)
MSTPAHVNLDRMTRPRRSRLNPMPAPTRAYPIPKDPGVSAVMRANRKTNTRPERRLRSELHARGLRYRVQFAIATTVGRVRADIAFPRWRLAVFVDGCFWHVCSEHGTAPRSNTWYWGPKLKRNIQRDREVDDALVAGGWQVVRVWEHSTAIEAADEIQRHLDSVRARTPAPREKRRPLPERGP